MIHSDPSCTSVGDAVAHFTNGRTRSPEELTDMFMRKFIFIGENAPPEIRVQGEAFADKVRALVCAYIKEAILEERAHCAFVAEASSCLAEAVIKIRR